MQYAILFSLLLVGVCFGHTFERQRYTQDDDSERMRDMVKMDSKRDSNKGNDMRDMKSMEENSQKQGYDSQRQGYNAQRQGNDAQRQEYSNRQENEEKQKQDSQSWDYNSQKQDLLKQSRDFQRRGFEITKPENSQQNIFNTQKTFAWEHYNNQKLDRSLKVDSNDQSREDSKEDVEKQVKLFNRERMLLENRRPKTALGLGEMGRQVSDYIRRIFGRGTDSSVAKIYSNQVPSFKDPLYIGELNTSFALITTKYSDVHFYGLKKAYQVVMQVDTKKHQVVAYIPLKRVDIKGQYTYSNRPVHNFTIILADTVYTQTMSYTVKDKKVELGESSAKIQYSHETSIYDRIGFIAQVLQGQLGKNLVTALTPQLYEYVSPKLTSQLEHTILDVTQNLERAHIVSGLQEGVYETFKQIQEQLAIGGNPNIELDTQNSQEYQYQHYRGQMVSVSLQHLQNLTLENNTVTYTDSMVHSHVNLSLSQPLISVTISYHSLQDSQKHEIHTQYLVDNMYATIDLHEDLSGGELQLVGVKVYVSKLQVAPSQGHYEGDVGGLINLLGTKLQHFLSQSLESFIKSQVSALLVKVNHEQHSDSHSAMKYRSESGYSGKQYSEDRESGKGQYSGNGQSDMGQYRNEKNSDSQSSGDKRQRYPGKME